MSVSPDAGRDLKALLGRFLRATEERDYPSCVACLPFAMKDHIDRDDMEEFLAHPGMDRMLAAVKAALEGGQAFDVDLDRLRATLTCGDVCVLECIFEVDGWKILNLRPVREPEKDGK